MKKISLLICCAIIALSLSACGSNAQSPQNTDGAVVTSEPEMGVDLTGEWEEIDGSEDTVHIATITNDTIEVYWFNKNDETKSLYWAGSFTPPTDNSKKYEWESINDKEKTDTAILASTSETKKFTYKDGQITYEASALGNTKTVKLEKLK